VVEALSRNGFKRSRPEEDAYGRLGAADFMEDDRGMRVDLFLEWTQEQIDQICLANPK